MFPKQTFPFVFREFRSAIKWIICRPLLTKHLKWSLVQRRDLEGYSDCGVALGGDLEDGTDGKVSA